MYPVLPAKTTIYFDDAEEPLDWEHNHGGLITLAYHEDRINALYASQGDAAVVPDAVSRLRQILADGRALGVVKAFEKAEKSGYNSNQVKLQKAGILRLKGDITHARSVLKEVENQASHNPEYHFQTASCYLQEGVRDKAITHFEKAVELDPSHTGALFQLGHSNDLAGNDDDAISFYERCMNHPPHAQ